MSASDHLGRQFGALSYEKGHTPEGDPAHFVGMIGRTSNNQPDFMGQLSWHPESGEILSLEVKKEHRRKGVATSLYNFAHQTASKQGLVAPKHSAERTEEGDAWAKSVGDKLPPLKKNIENYHGRLN